MKKLDEEKIKEKALNLGIKMVVLFGSRASRKEREDSDYDIAVLMTPEKNIKKSIKIYTEVLFFLSDTLGIPDEKIDLTNLNNANLLLAHQIFSEGKLLYGSRNLFDEKRAVSYREYIDARPLFDLENIIIHKRQKLLKMTLANI